MCVWLDVDEYGRMFKMLFGVFHGQGEAREFIANHL
jgi:hypothetical protein